MGGNRKVGPSYWDEFDRMYLRPSGYMGTTGRATRERLPQTPLGARSTNTLSRTSFNPYDDEGITQDPISLLLSQVENPSTIVPKPDVPKPPPLPPVPVPGGQTTTTTTDPGSANEQAQPDPYPTVLPSLSAEQLGQLAERRRLADERLQQAEAESERRRGLLEATSNRARDDAERMSRRTLQDFMRQAAGRGLARSPMVAGRQIRRTGEDLRLQYGEIDTRLSADIAALQDMVTEATNTRNQIIAGIEQERVNMQADLERLFPAAGMIG